jgi:hypothetical protein
MDNTGSIKNRVAQEYYTWSSPFRKSILKIGVLTAISNKPKRGSFSAPRMLSSSHSKPSNECGTHIEAQRSVITPPQGNRDGNSSIRHAG